MIIYFILMQSLKEEYPSFVSISSKIEVKNNPYESSNNNGKCHVKKKKASPSLPRSREQRPGVVYFLL